MMSMDMELVWKRVNEQRYEKNEEVILDVVKWD